MQAKSTKRIYLDYAATTPVDPRVLKAMEPYFAAKFGNPGSLHSFGQEAIAAVDRAREITAHAIGAEFREILFTSSATEANNLVLLGAVDRWQLNNKKSSTAQNPRILVSAIEHESILETARELQRNNVEVIYIPVDKNGIVDLAHIKKSLNSHTILVSVMCANNEIGTIQPVAEIAKIIADFKKSSAKENTSAVSYPLLHTDAAQAFQFLNCDVTALGIDMMTLSSHKIYGPKGAAALYVKNAGDNRRVAIYLRPLILGGGQEYGLRSGTENIPAVVGFAKAVELISDTREKESKRTAALRDELWRGIKKISPKAERNGAGSLPNILNVYFPHYAAQDLLTRFDLAGLAVSSGSACRSRAFEASYVITELGYSKERAKASIRFSLGRPVKKNDIEKSIKIISNIFINRSNF